MPKILIAYFLKSIHLTPQTAAWTTFSTPIPEILHLVVFGKNLYLDNVGFAFEDILKMFSCNSLKMAG